MEMRRLLARGATQFCVGGTILFFSTQKVGSLLFDLPLNLPQLPVASAAAAAVPPRLQPHDRCHVHVPVGVAAACAHFAHDQCGAAVLATATDKPA